MTTYYREVDPMSEEAEFSPRFVLPVDGPLLTAAEWRDTGERIWRCVWHGTLQTQMRCEAGRPSNHKDCGWVILVDAAVGEVDDESR